MKLIKTFVVFILILALFFTEYSCKNELTKMQKQSVIGDYLFDYREMSFVFLTTVYEEDGELYAFSGLADYPVKMKLVDAVTNEYRIKFKRSGDFNLKFSQSKNDVFIRLSFKSNTSDFEIIGFRVKSGNNETSELFSKNSGELHLSKTSKPERWLGSIYNTRSRC